MEHIAALLLPGARFEVHTSSGKMDILGVSMITPDQKKFEFEVHRTKYSITVFMPQDIFLQLKPDQFLSGLNSSLSRSFWPMCG
jgi:hypothetical protein